MGLQIVKESDSTPRKVVAAVYSRVSTIGHGQDPAMQTRDSLPRTFLALLASGLNPPPRPAVSPFDRDASFLTPIAAKIRSLSAGCNCVPRQPLAWGKAIGEERPAIFER